MSEEIYDDDDEETAEESTRKRIEVDAADWRKTRKKAKEYDALAQERDEARQQLAIYDAGLTSLTPKQRTALLKVHDGEWDAESLQATAEELGYWSPPETDVAAEDAPALQRMNEVAAGNGQAPSKAKQLLAELDPRQLTEEEFWAKAEAAGVVATD